METKFNNPVGEPISIIWKELRSLKFMLPYIHVLLVCLILLVVLALLSAIYITFGLLAVFISIISDIINRYKIKLSQTSGAQRSAYVVIIGIVSLVFMIAWIIQLPFLLFGIVGSNIFNLKRKLLGWLDWVGRFIRGGM